MTDHYAGTAAGWARSVSRVYGPLARELVAASPVPLAGAVTLDLGAGTGLVSAALSAVGARPVALDRSPDMLRWRREERPPAAVADATRLPLRADAVQAAFAAFLLNHLPDPVPALRELARVTRPGRRGARDRLRQQRHQRRAGPGGRGRARPRLPLAGVVPAAQGRLGAADRARPGRWPTRPGRPGSLPSGPSSTTRTSG